MFAYSNPASRYWLLDRTHALFRYLSADRARIGTRVQVLPPIPPPPLPAETCAYCCTSHQLSSCPRRWGCLLPSPQVQDCCTQRNRAGELSPWPRKGVPQVCLLDYVWYKQDFLVIAKVPIQQFRSLSLFLLPSHCSLPEKAPVVFVRRWMITTL